MARTRKQELGDFGEERARRLLRDKKGLDVEKMPNNFPFFDLMAKQGTRRLLVAVTTRNKFTAKGSLKRTPHNLYDQPGHYESAKRIATFFGAEIVWVAVTVDTTTKTFSACTGDVSKLPSPKRIPMHPAHNVPRYEPLATDEDDDEIKESWSDISETVRV